MALNERLGSDKPAISGREEYAPPNRRAPEKLNDADEAAADVVEGEIHDIVRRIRDDAATGPTAVTAAENVNELIRRVSGASTEEIDHVIFEPQVVRDMLRSEGERVSREIAGYASLSHGATTAMKVITDSLRQWKSAPHTSGPRS